MISDREWDRRKTMALMVAALYESQAGLDSNISFQLAVNTAEKIAKYYGIITPIDDEGTKPQHEIIKELKAEILQLKLQRANHT